MPVLHVSYVDSVLLIDLATKKQVRAKPFYAVIENGAIFAAPEGFGLTVDSNVYPTPDVFFPEVDIVPNQPVLPGLWHMWNAVNGAIGVMENYAVSCLADQTR